MTTVTRDEANAAYEPYWAERPVWKSLDVGDGWLSIVFDLIVSASSVKPDIKVVQVKEKFGSLRFYYNGVDPAVDDLVRQAEQRSTETCEVCGSSGKLGARNGWWSTVCEADARSGWTPYSDDEADDSD